MDYVLIYFSGTGNTKLISEEIQKRLEKKHHNVELISIESLDRIERLNLQKKVIGIGFPVYKFTYPDIMNKLFPLLKAKQEGRQEDSPFFLYCTYTRFDADSLHNFARKMEKLAFRLIVKASFKCPSNGIASMKSAESYEYSSVMFFEDNIADKLDQFADEIANNSAKYQNSDFRLKHTGKIYDSIRLKIVEDIERTKYPRLRINQDLCNICGLCAAHCPETNLVNMGKKICIIDEFACLHCLRCMHHCPKYAISFGELTTGPQRYTIKVRNKLFDKAASGYKEKYWWDFNSIRKKWKQKTIKYWILHRRWRKTAK
ncbi:MAG: EFR1 family ferrodoxin [Candidatus Cloacimonetes bacterium]|nr:EFR1 family ferrodoxin [Candidatus Cloacimonadota bacterium]